MPEVCDGFGDGLALVSDVPRACPDLDTPAAAHWLPIVELTPPAHPVNSRQQLSARGVGQ